MPPAPGTVKDALFHVTLSDGSKETLRTGPDGKTAAITRDRMHLATAEVKPAPHQGGYPAYEGNLATDTSVMLHGEGHKKIVYYPRDNPCNVIVVHGVNDVGSGYGAVEEGLCAGLADRLLRPFVPARYTLPTAKDKDETVDDPDAKFFRRQATADTCSPVIPFYWGYRESSKVTRVVNGQHVDQYGTRLDKDLSKGGGPFGNATSSLPDMWNRGIYAPVDPVGDPLRPICSGPGRMYMVLAAQRLAALVAMMRQYEAQDTVNIVAHSQGCLVTLLAQALLLERGERPADTLILTHPPYSLDEEMGVRMELLNFFQGGSDAAMDGRYADLAGRQSLHGRLQTLVNIVKGVTHAKATSPDLMQVNEYDNVGMVGWHWQPSADRDNRGKVYLYFCPEDMTVALDNMRGIGWQGVPDYLEGTQCKKEANSSYAASHGGAAAFRWKPVTVTRSPLYELGAAFHQRVFSAKLRPDLKTGKPMPALVGQPPQDFALRLKGENDHAHVAESVQTLRESLPEATWPVRKDDPLLVQRQGIRRITGEALPRPFRADLRGSQIDADKIPATSHLAQVALKHRGPAEEVDPITAAIAVSASRLRRWMEEVPDPNGYKRYPTSTENLSSNERKRIQDAYNRAKGTHPNNPDDTHFVLLATRQPDGTVLAEITERPRDARLRWQHELGEKSFHSAIFDSAANHQHVTAYDLSIGSGKATSDPGFRAYLSAVADWRLKIPNATDKPRENILRWSQFSIQFARYYACEPDWRRELIHANASYYSSGELPKSLPLLAGKLARIVISETTEGRRIDSGNN
ncbi:MAG: T6SS effector phospholipase Tle3 domain-containing protein [Telluria sp.]